MFSHLGEVNEVQSSVLSRMKRVSTLNVKTNGSPKVKRHTLVFTSYKTSLNSKSKIKDKEQASSHPVTVWEADDLKAKTGSTEAPETLENIGDFQDVLANGKFLKRHFPSRQLLEHTPEYELKLLIKKKRNS